MKKLVALILASLSVFTLSGCREITQDDLSSFSHSLSKNTVSAFKPKPNSNGKKEDSSETSADDSSTVSSDTLPTTTSSAVPSSGSSNKSSSSNKNTSSAKPSSNSTGSIQLTEEDVNKVVAEFNRKEGLQYANLSNAKNTDTVSMINLYTVNFTGEFADIDARVMNAYNNNLKIEIDTGLATTPANMEFVNRYINKLYSTKGIRVEQYYSNGGNILIDSAPLIERKTVLENKPYYQNIQSVIRNLGIYKGMRQKDAIERFNKYICERVTYNSGSNDASLNTFFQGRAICNSYAQVFEILCRTVGIDCKFLGGTALAPQGTTEKHAWNKITFSDGTVYYFDTCWNDADIIINGQVFKRYDRYMFVTSFASRNVVEERTLGYYEYQN